MAGRRLATDGLELWEQSRRARPPLTSCCCCRHRRLPAPLALPARLWHCTMLLAVRRLGHTALLFPCCCRRSSDVTGFEALRRWAAANPNAESERLLAKLCIQIAVNRMLRWVPICCLRCPCCIAPLLRCPAAVGRCGDAGPLHAHSCCRPCPTLKLAALLRCAHC